MPQEFQRVPEEMVPACAFMRELLIERLSEDHGGRVELRERPEHEGFTLTTFTVNLHVVDKDGALKSIRTDRRINLHTTARVGEGPYQSLIALAPVVPVAAPTGKSWRIVFVWVTLNGAESVIYLPYP